MSNSTTTLLTSHLEFKQVLLEDDSFNAPSTTHIIYNIPEVNEDSLSFFFPYYQLYTSPMGSFPNKPVDDESELPTPFRTYQSPAWNNWTEVWNKPPIELDTNTLPSPDLEFLFQSVLFRVTLNSTYFAAVEEYRLIHQGTTFTFKGYDHEDVRFVVEWLQFIHNHNAYLKIVAMTSDGKRIPYTDPDYPSFILIAPLCLVYVPTPPPGLELYYAYPLDNEAIEEGENVEICRVCNFAF